MIVVLKPMEEDPGATVREVTRIAGRFAGIEVRPYTYRGTQHELTEIHLVGPTAAVPTDLFESLPGVLRVVRVSTRYRLIGRHDGGAETAGFDYNGVTFDDRTLNVFAGLCAVDSPEHVEAMMAALQAAGIVTTRMGAYKPRTSPYDFQGLGRACLPYVFELAGRYGIRAVAMEVTDARHIDEIRDALAAAGDPTGVLLQVGTRNAQNFELLKAVGRQQRFPVLFKRGMGISLEESLNACEYVASEGNPRILFCLRGVKTHLGDPHRNLVDFAHVPVVRRQTRLPVCIDPSHSVGRMDRPVEGVPDVFLVTAQGVIAGATSVLIDFHPRPETALCDGPQALRLEQLPGFLHYVRSIRAAYQRSVEELRGQPPAPVERR
ncbi:MAG TPA: 3-deoxy-7-phosphoheptulonate synthase [Thermoanaerobaculia bacterium]|nr:3-deoxy-7-phosphoheptulonate synthase [Thermoanaerobaculia bacterium]